MKIVKRGDLPETTTSHNGVGKKKVLIAKGEMPHLMQFAQVALRPGEVASEHKHDDMHEVFLVEHGNGMIRIQGQEYPMEVGMCITVEPGEMHEVTNTGEVELILTYFEIVTV